MNFQKKILESAFKMEGCGFRFWLEPSIQKFLATSPLALPFYLFFYSFSYKSVVSTCEILWMLTWVLWQEINLQKSENRQTIKN